MPSVVSDVDRAAEDRNVKEQNELLASRISSLPPSDVEYALELLSSQVREVWSLRRMLAAAQAGLTENKGSRRGSSQLRLFEAEARTARQEQAEEAEICAELAHEARNVAHQFDSLLQRDRLRDSKLPHWEKEAVRWEERASAQAAGLAAAVRGEELAQAEQAMMREQFEESQRHSASELLSLRFECSDLAKQCGDLRGELVQAQAKLSVTGLRQTSAEEARGYPPAAPASTQPSRQDDLRGSVRWHDSGAVFDTFASASGPAGRLRSTGSPRMLPADFGYLCECLRRAQGRGPSREEDRKDFADFAFSATFGSEEAAVDRASFVRLFPHFALILQELEDTYAHEAASRLRLGSRFAG
eukprot:TRINITY_DN90812_c0_g1_i1.p1 TRINITY_DN90812_c0_g1~~TRINITY_DN90812_c0_g1_i1.p1  ORF type:complete len:358 (+),score=82.85 TRINITY_DN90812_c0_g1_i1:1-1074(+)